MATRRTKYQRESDRTKLLAHIKEHGADTHSGIRAPEWAAAGDLAALEKQGHITKTVKREWDKSVGYQANKFGGAAVMQRHRAYYKPAEVFTDRREEE